MSIRPMFRRGLLAAALAVALSGAALAGDTFETETRVELRTKAGAIETLKLDELAVGEVKALRAESGTTVIASRGAEGYVLEIGNEEFELPDFDADVVALHHGDAALAHAVHAEHAGHVERHVFVKHADEHAKHADKRVVVDTDALPGDGKKVVVVRKHLLPGDGESLGAFDGASPSLGDPGNEGKRILVMRRVRRDVAETGIAQ